MYTDGHLDRLRRLRRLWILAMVAAWQTASAAYLPNTRGRDPQKFKQVLSAERVAELRRIPGLWAGENGVTVYAADVLSLFGQVAFAPSVHFDGWDCLRDYQRDAVTWLRTKDWGILALPTRTGKSLTALADVALRKSDRILIIAPAIAKRVWQRECQRWLGESPGIAYGRRGDEIRIDGKKVKDADPRILIVNYDILYGQSERSLRGVVSDRVDLPGWAPRLSETSYDTVIIDECQKIRTAKLEAKLRPSIKLATSRAKRCIGLSATPMDLVRHLWPQLDLLSDGQWGSKKFQFEARYADAHKRMTPIGREVWWADGESNLAELKKRLEVVLWQPDPETCRRGMPPIQYQVIQLDATDDETEVRGFSERSLVARRKRDLKAKLPAITENVIADVESGQSIVILTKYRHSAEAVATHLERRLKHVKLWQTHGEEDSDTRARKCEAFVDHVESGGIGCFVATVDSLPGSVSLRGASVIHVAELHESPLAIRQAIERPYEPGCTGLTVLFYTLENSYDDHLFEMLEPKMQQICKTLNDPDASRQKAIFERADDIAPQDVWAKLLKKQRFEDE